MKITNFLFSLASLSLGGCLSISAGCGASRDRVITVPVQAVQTTTVTWPPANVVLDPQAVYVTGLSDQMGVNGRVDALTNANSLARGMGLSGYTLTEVCQDLNYLGSNGFSGTRILYRVIPAAK